MSYVDAQWTALAQKLNQDAKMTQFCHSLYIAGGASALHAVVEKLQASPQTREGALAAIQAVQVELEASNAILGASLL